MDCHLDYYLAGKKKHAVLKHTRLLFHFNIAPCLDFWDCCEREMAKCLHFCQNKLSLGVSSRLISYLPAELWLCIAFVQLQRRQYLSFRYQSNLSSRDPERILF